MRMPLGLKPQWWFGNLQGLTSTPPRRCLAFGACNLEVVYCCQGLKDENLQIAKSVPRYPSCRPGGVDASETASQLRSECLRRVGELDNEISTRALEDTERFQRKGSFLCLFWIHFFLQSFSVELIKKLLVSWRLWNHFATRSWSLMDIAAVLKLPPATHWMRRGTTHHSGQPKQLGIFFPNPKTCAKSQVELWRQEAADIQQQHTELDFSRLLRPQVFSATKKALPLATSLDSRSKLAWNWDTFSNQEAWT